MLNRLTIASCLAVLAACGKPQVAESPTTAPDVADLARDYVVLELAMGQIDADHVDAYSGPDELKRKAEQLGWDLDQIAAESKRVRASLDAVDDGDAVRIQGLLDRLTALDMRININRQQYAPFDVEAKALFGVSAPDFGPDHFDQILAEIDALLPGDASLPERVEAFKAQFAVPADKVDTVFQASIEECRRRTLEYIELPDNESFTIEYVTDKSWSGYNWYQGNAHSLIQVNTDFPLQISRAVDLGCHEGYPGHHTFNALLEKELLNDKGWVEYSLYPLFSQQSLIAEGTGNYGIKLAFPAEERVAYERDVLFPLAGLDASQADRYYALQALLAGLSYAGNEAARDYLNGDITREEAIAWLVKYGLSSPERAAQRTRFFDQYRSYVINYNLGQDLVQAHIERGDADAQTRWARFEQMISTPFSPADFQQ
ncbi:MAG: hypothetical protein AAGJ86_03280 [Pseudomonadota bacterium]